MKNQWLVWAFIAGVIIIVIVAFNSENQRKAGRYVEDVPAEVQYEDEIIAEEPAGVAPAVKDESVKSVTVVQTMKADMAKTGQETYQMAESKVAAVVSQVSADADQIIADTQGSGVLTAQNVADFSGVAYTIQIASVKELKDAQRVLADVLKKNHPGYVVQRNLGEKGTWYRVYVGKFGVKADAEAALPGVKKDFTSAFVIAPPKKSQ